MVLPPTRTAPHHAHPILSLFFFCHGYGLFLAVVEGPTFNRFVHLGPLSAQNNQTRRGKRRVSKPFHSLSLLLCKAMSTQPVENDALEKAGTATEALYSTRDTYFPANPDDKIARLKSESDLALNLLDSIPQGTELNIPASFASMSLSFCFSPKN